MLDFKAYANKLGVELTTESGPGIYDWKFWDTWIQRVLEWLPLKEKAITT